MAEYGLHFGPTMLSSTSGLAPTFTHFVRLDTGATLAGPGITQIISGLGMYKFNYTPSFPIYFEIDGATTGLGAYRYIQGMLDPLDELTAQLSGVGATNQAIGATLLQGQVNFGSTLVAIGNTLTGVGNTLASINVGGIGTTLVYVGDQVLALGVTNQAIGVTLVQGQANIGTTLVAIGNTVLGIGNTLIGISGLAVSLAGIETAIGSTASLIGDNVTDPATLYGYLKRLQNWNEGDSVYTKATGVWEVSAIGGNTLLASKTLDETLTTVTKS